MMLRGLAETNEVSWERKMEFFYMENDVGR
jgi:hypothetical protein